MTKIYVLKCNQGRYYVGKTTNVDRRFAEHLTGALSSAWTKLYTAQEIIEVKEMVDNSDEMTTTLKYMKNFGIDNVRGAQWSNINLTSEQRTAIQLAMSPNACFLCRQNGHFAKNCPQRKQPRRSSSPSGFFRCEENDDDANIYLHNSTAKHCQRCGRDSHNESTCYAFLDVNGLVLGCVRCGRDSHSLDNCYATFDVKRRRLN